MIDVVMESRIIRGLRALTCGITSRVCGAVDEMQISVSRRTSRSPRTAKTRVGGDAGFNVVCIWQSGWHQTLVRLTVWQKMAWQPVTFRRPSPVMIIVPE